MDKKLLIGIAIGVLVPFLIVGLIYLITYILLENMVPSKELLSSIVIFGIAFNAIIANFHHKRGKERRSMGVMIATMVLVVVWSFIFLL